MDYELIKVERGGEIAVVTFNRPDKANAVNYQHLQEIEHAALSFRDDETARVVIFAGAGKHFNSGADLTGKDPDHPLLTVRRRRKRIGERCIQALRDMDQITIAAWRGAAMGGGACIATALDFRIGARDCFMSYPEILIGVNLMWQSLPLCVHLVGPARAKRLVIGGEHISGPTLLDWGVLDEMVEAEEVMDKAMEWARHYAGQPPVAAQMIKRSVNAISSALDRSIMHMDFDQNILSAETEDAAQAVSAYLEKRPPTFTGN
ncbi:MAG: enoyl-CoA hydratase/isomerase family protein [Alphaproteobacteria bacterium]|jgi:enoyl-CoA hydratase/carnithine racemase|nr:enoyl-CoA hydratase/isomerase family protein [Alphaproteobacteria bacterium]MDP6830379.1 enoyl-CoA hydratase/isomerase family protein [Alphaproteobacteria bacterium]MDP6872721.1 enoyl-CoA hydratase/isomerase family protein [Alphaproteobacteria bacterium]